MPRISRVTELAIPASFDQRPYAAKHFREIATWAREEHPFYRFFYANCSGALPLLTRHILQAHNDELLNGCTVTGRTSGATSIPVRVHWSKQRTTIEQNDDLKFSRLLGGKLPNVKIVSLQAHQHAVNTLDVASPPKQQADFLMDCIATLDTQCLISYPTNLVQLAQWLLTHLKPITAIVRIVCMSELFDPVQEQIIQRAFPNAQIAATYSCTEVGCIAFRCPHAPNFHHIWAHKLGVEILDEANNPCAEGVLGRLVITDYFNRAMPLIRYDIGDLAAPAICPCGVFTLPALTRLIGKSRSLLQHADGTKVFSTELSPTFRDSIEIVQYQVHQLSVQSFQVRAVLKPQADQIAFEQRIVALFQRMFGEETAVAFDWCDQIPRLPGGKYLEFNGIASV